MKIIHHASEGAAVEGKICIALGMFDGVHLGHQRVLRQTLEDVSGPADLAVAVTFDRHPNAVVAPQRTPPLIYSLDQRLRVIGSLGIETTLLIHFDRAFSQQGAETFITGLARDFGRLRSISVGRNFVFGHKRNGNVTLLKALGQQLGFVVHELAPVQWQGHTISSTHIREVIQSGDIALASQLLGRPYSIAGRVLRGKELGRKLGFPTANLAVTGLALPPRGVYAGRARIGAGVFPAVANLGSRPTIESGHSLPQLEVHLMGVSADLYGQELEFEITSRLRGEVKFASIEALQAQIGKDVAAAERILR